MRFAIKTSPQDTTWPAMLAVWQAADEIELFESAWTFDHFYPIFTEAIDGDCMEGWITLTALAQATRRLRLGVLVSATPYRHPAVLAKMAATVDIVSGGRLELGIGAGWNVVEARAYNLELREDLTERFDAFDEVCEALIGLLTDERTTYAGRYVQLTDAYCNPKPIQRPHPPICIGGQGEQRTLRSVARFAQHWNFPGGTPSSSRRSSTCCARTAPTSGATRRRSRCRRIWSACATGVASTRWWRRRSATPTPASTSASSICRRRSPRPSWNRSPPRSCRWS